MQVSLGAGMLDGNRREQKALVGFAAFAGGYYTTIDHQKVQDSNPRPCTPGMHYTTIDHEGHNILLVDIMICACTFKIRFLDHTKQLVGFKLT
jgi:hypothetical protein